MLSPTTAADSFETLRLNSYKMHYHSIVQSPCRADTSKSEEKKKDTGDMHVVIVSVTSLRSSSRYRMQAWNVRRKIYRLKHRLNTDTVTTCMEIHQFATSQHQNSSSFQDFVKIWPVVFEISCLS